MLTDNWKDLAGKAQSTFQNSLKQAIDLADFDDELAKNIGSYLQLLVQIVKTLDHLLSILWKSI